jgi:hypothetical protein
MVIRTNIASSRRALLNLEIAVAIAIVAGVVLPLAFMFAYEGKLLRTYYRDAVAMQILDGEMEVLAAGEWRHFSNGRHDYAVNVRSATNLPPGRFVLTRADKAIRIEWFPQRGRAMRREATLP